ncbi:MAG: MotA/TolQ/ExbB proton channel family protein [Puniceicoccales bacterium]|jgi:biopolymer transport protein ExbB|nr:MotA/TolQ/ExbB proton channel family protein [Puniceicoccales bacterium]
MPNAQTLSLFSSAGPFLWPLLLLSVLALAFFFERFHFLHRGQIRAGEFLAGIKNTLRRHRNYEALTACEEAPGPVPRIVKAILLLHDKSESEMRSAAESVALTEIHPLERRIGSIGAIAKLAPLVGLIGTILALARAFWEMHNRGHYATADAFAGDVAAALSATALGLILAAFAHFAHHLLSGRVRSIVHDMEWAAHETIQFLQYDLPREEAKTPPTPAPKA